MAPLPGEAASSLDRIAAYMQWVKENLVTRSASSSDLSTSHSSTNVASSSNLFSRSSPLLAPRDVPFTPPPGITPAANIPNNAIFALFGLIGASFVLTGIWFFFWAKNGGFVFREGDWEEYKSTVLRRKGPNGTTLSNGTRSTDLGGGSVVHGDGKGRRNKWGRKEKRFKDVEEEGEGESSLGSVGTMSELSDLKSGIEARDFAPRDNNKSKSKHKAHKSSKRPNKKPNDDLESVTTESVLGNDEAPESVIRAYRHEKPARVGGLNRAADGSAFEGSDVHSDLLSNREKTPTSTPTKTPTTTRGRKERMDNYTGGSGSPTKMGIRRVETVSAGGGGGGGGAFSGFWGGGSKKDREKEEKIKSEAKKLQEKGRAATGGRRDFSYTVGDDALSAISGSTGTGTADEERRERRERRRSRQAREGSGRVPGSYVSEVGSEVGGAGGNLDGGSDVSGVSGTEGSGTKSYHHPIPGLSEYAEERRRERKSKGYRRDV
jgi:hypothetical protein